MRCPLPVPSPRLCGERARVSGLRFDPEQHPILTSACDEQNRRQGREDKAEKNIASP